MADTLADFLDQVTEDAAPSYRPEPWYNSYGDCIHYHWREDEFYREWIDDKLTVYRSLVSGNAVGIEIKGIVALMNKVGKYGIKIDRTDGTPLALLILTAQASADSPNMNAGLRQQTYNYIVEQVAAQKVEISAPAEPSSVGCTS